MYFAIMSRNTKCRDLRTFQGKILVNNPAIRQFWTLCSSAVVLGSIYRRHGSAIFLWISPVIQPYGLLGTVKSEVQYTGRCTVQWTLHCPVFFVIQYMYVGYKDTHCGCTRHTRKTKLSLVFPKWWY